jgi:hypothetical protein
LISFDDDDDVTGGFVVDDGVDERCVCSDEDASTFLLLIPIDQAKNRNVSTEEIVNETIYRLENSI